MQKGRKIRNLVEKDNINITLDDVLAAAVKLSGPLIDLEYGNTKTKLAESKKLIRDLEKKANALGRRIRGEVFEEVHTYAKKNNKNYVRDVNRFKNE